MNTVDIILPYVDSTDPLWLEDFTNTIKQDSPSPVRFRSWGTLKYVLRAIETYIPFVRDIILVVARESQIPDWLNRDKVRIIYHKDFIPEQFLPVFNSCTIEDFLYNIPDVSEQFLYTNDDIFPINPLQLEDFFIDGKPKIKFTHYTKYAKDTIFRGQCRASIDFISTAMGWGYMPPEELLVPAHSITPMLKSSVDKVGELCKDKFADTITSLRSPCNVNQYIYSDYNFVTDNYVKGTCEYVYLDMMDNLTEVSYGFTRSNLKIICINDSFGIKDYEKTQAGLIEILEQKYPQKSEYEQ